MEQPQCPGCRERDARIAELEAEIRKLKSDPRIAELQAKVLDFGLAKNVDGTGRDATMTSGGPATGVGTVVGAV